MKESAHKKKVRISHFASRRLAELLKPYHSGWVALSPDERQIVAAGETLHETRERASHPTHLAIRVSTIGNRSGCKNAMNVAVVATPV